jgi:TolB-like protein
LLLDEVPRGNTFPSASRFLREVRRLDDVVSEAVKAESVTRPSIAVLPFGNMSDDPKTTISATA